MSNELTHHGIVGMKWGKRNGPPYPLSSGAMSSTERKWAKGDGKGDSGDDPGTGPRKKDYKPRSITTTKRKRAKVAKQMSDKELTERIKRLEKETRYLQLEKNLDDLNPNSGKSTAMKVLSTIGNKVVLPTMTAAFGYFVYNKIAQHAEIDNKAVQWLAKAFNVDETSTEWIRKTLEKSLFGKK